MKKIFTLLCTLCALNAFAQIKYDTICNSDFTWKTSTTLYSDWNKPSFSSINWNTPVLYPNQCGYNPYTEPSQKYNLKSKQIWDVNTSASIFFARNTFTILDTSLLLSANLRLAADDDAMVYINGVLVNNNDNCIASYDVINIKSFLISGPNLIAV